MRCAKCNAETNILDRVCSHCGESLSLFSGAPPPRSNRPDSLLDSVSKLLDSELRKAERELFEEQRPEATGRTGPVVTFRAETSKPPARNGAPAGASADLESTDLDIQQIASFVFFSPHVQNNPLYRMRAGATTLLYFPDNPTVNAFATDHPIEGAPHGPPSIVFFGGLAHTNRLVAIGLSIDKASAEAKGRGLFRELIKKVGERIVAKQGRFGLDDSHLVYERMELGSRFSGSEMVCNARSYIAAMNFAVIAHELGHICLGHTLGSQCNAEISRNQEREADSFASSVASAGPFSNYIVAGGIFWWVILTWVESISGNTDETSHPHARERLMDYIRSNRGQALSLGIDEKTVLEFLP